MRLENISMYIQRGKSPKYTEIKEFPVISQKCVQWSGFDIEPAKFITKDSLDSYTNDRFLQDKDLLWNSTGLGTLGRIAIYFANLNPYNFAVADSHVTVIRLFEKVLPEYIFLYLSSPIVQMVIEDKSDGSTKQKELSLNTITQYAVPLPPLNEQHRIVAKIEELLPFIEQYDKQEQALKTLNKNFPEQLKKSILQAAIQGKLTEQLPTDEPTSQLLKRIEAEKVRLISEGKLKKPRVRDNSQNEKFEPPFEIPQGWEWVRLEEITYTVGNKSNQVQTKEYLKEGIYPIVSQAEKLIDGFTNDKNKIIMDLPLIMFGDHTRNVKYIDFLFAIGADGTKFHKCILSNSKYIYFWMLISSYALRNRGYARHYSLLKTICIPLPPLEEQKRIVEKVELLLSQIEHL